MLSLNSVWTKEPDQIEEFSEKGSIFSIPIRPLPMMTEDGIEEDESEAQIVSEDRG